VTFIRDKRTYSALDPRYRYAFNTWDEFGESYLRDTLNSLASDARIAHQIFSISPARRQRIILAKHATKRSEPEVEQIAWSNVSQAIFRREHRMALDILAHFLANPALLPRRSI
jgi:hypothetical protein